MQMTHLHLLLLEYESELKNLLLGCMPNSPPPESQTLLTNPHEVPRAKHHSHHLDYCRSLLSGGLALSTYGLVSTQKSKGSFHSSSFITALLFCSNPAVSPQQAQKKASCFTEAPEINLHQDLPIISSLPGIFENPSYAPSQSSC